MTLLGAVLTLELLILAVLVLGLALLLAELRVIRDNGLALRARVRALSAKLEEMDAAIAAWFEALRQDRQPARRGNDDRVRTPQDVDHSS